mgnify:CR=1 FL=1
MNILSWIAEWYSSNCDESWEHSYGVKIDKQPPHTRDFSRELGGSSCNLLPHMV